MTLYTIFSILVFLFKSHWHALFIFIYRLLLVWEFYKYSTPLGKYFREEKSIDSLVTKTTSQQIFYQKTKSTYKHVTNTKYFVTK